MLTKLHRPLFDLLILFLPSQAGLHFWPEFAHVLGLRIDYLSPTLFLTDIILVLMLASWFGSLFLKKETLSFTNEQKFFLLLAYCFLLISFLSLFFAQSFEVGGYKTARLLEMVMLAVYVVANIKTRAQVGRVIVFLTIGALYSSLLAILQFFSQHSLGVWFLGERTFSAVTSGISLASLDGQQILRPYATFPHPNVLAGYLVVVLILGLYLVQKIKNLKILILYILGFMLVFSALFLTFSRTAWVAVVFGVLWVFGYELGVKKNFFKILKQKFLIIIIPLFILLSLVAYYLSPVIIARFSSLQTTDSHGLILRQKFNSAAVQMVHDSPFLGIGMGNFLVRLPQYFTLEETIRIIQPAHNLFLLVAAETGIFGLLSFILIFFIAYRSLFKRLRTGDNLALYFLITLTLIIFLGLFDHYFWTLQQGQLLFWLIIGLCYSQVVKKA